jgi:hypothetical protein
MFEDLRRSNPNSNVLAYAITSIPRSFLGTGVPLKLKKELIAHTRLWNYLTDLDNAAKSYEWEEWVLGRFTILCAWRDRSELTVPSLLSGFGEHEQVLLSLAPLKQVCCRMAKRWTTSAVAPARVFLGRVRMYMRRQSAARRLKRLCSPCCAAPCRLSNQKKLVDLVFRLIGFRPYRCTRCNDRFYRFRRPPVLSVR